MPLDNEREYLFMQIYLQTFHPEAADWHDDRPMFYDEGNPQDVQALYDRLSGRA